MHRVENMWVRELTTAISRTNSARCCSKTVGLDDRFLGIGVVDIVVVCVWFGIFGLGGRTQ